jgi:hypothetical protein
MLFFKKGDLMIYLNNEEERLKDNNRMLYIHGCVTCKLKSDCVFTNSKVITCDRYWADLTYKPTT